MELSSSSSVTSKKHGLPQKEPNIDIITKESSNDCSSSYKGKINVWRQRKIHSEETKFAEFRD